MAMRPWSCGIALVLATACGDNRIVEEPQPATEEVTLEVPEFAASAPFDVPRTMVVPPGFGIRVIARVPVARFLAETPEGGLLVSRPVDGEAVKVSGVGGTPSVTTIMSGLTLPHDLVFTQRDGALYLYVSEHHRVSRAPWTAGSVGTLETVVDNLPNASLPELHGAYGHGLKNIAIIGDQL